MVYEARAGQTFMLGASTWRIEEITRDRVLVSPAPGVPGAIPFWKAVLFFFVPIEAMWRSTFLFGYRIMGRIKVNAASRRRFAELLRPEALVGRTRHPDFCSLAGDICDRPCPWSFPLPTLALMGPLDKRQGP